MSTEQEKTISLVLGSGGARGLAHIGVIRELEASGFRIAAISGCSIGALVGGIYAAGKLDEFESWINAITKVDIVTLLDLSWGRNGLVKGDKIINTLVDLVGDKTIEELPIPFTAVATDLENEKEVWINSGSLFDAIRASISLPLFFTPVPYKQTHLIDGGVLNPVPIAPTFDDGTDITVAINLGGPLDKSFEEVVDEPPPAADLSPFRKKVRRYIDKWQADDGDGDGKDWSVYDVANMAFDAMQGTIARQKLAAYPPDVVIEIARNACGTLEFDRASQMIELGRQKTRDCIEQARKHGSVSG
jgi:NTE family protein